PLRWRAAGRRWGHRQDWTGGRPDRGGGNMYRSLLVPLNRSSFAEQALPLALGIAPRAGALLDLVEGHATYALEDPTAGWVPFEPDRNGTEEGVCDAANHGPRQSTNPHVPARREVGRALAAGTGGVLAEHPGQPAQTHPPR